MAKRSIFYKIYFSFIALFLVALTLMLLRLGGWLKSYEAAQPINLINNITDTYLKNGELDYLRDNFSLKISPYETEENMNSFFQNNIKDKTLSTVLSSARPEGTDAAYVVKADDKKILNIYLNKDDSSASFLPKYTVAFCEFDKDFYKTISVTMPHNSTVSINGKALIDADCKEIGIPQFVEKYLKNENAVKQKAAEITNLLSDEVIVTAEQSGKQIDVKKADNSYSVYQYIDENVKKNIRNVATEGSKAYANYMQGDATLSDVAAYFDTGSDFYKNIRSSYTDHILEHSLMGFDNVVNDEIFKYSDNIYSCRVDFTQVLKRNGMTYKIYFKKYVFVQKNGDSFKIIDIKNPEES